MLDQARKRAGPGETEAGSTLVQTAVCLLIVAALVAGATPYYRSSTQEARTTEAKVVAGALWTALTSSAIAVCGRVTTVSAAYPRAGLDTTGATTPRRWQVVTGASTGVTVDCTSGTYDVSGDVFTVGGVADDVSEIRVALSYSPTAAPAARLRCSLDGGAAWTDC
jgi:Tfp pilus assembly protein PilE